MPYRLNPDDNREVQVQKGGRWQRLKRHPSVIAAKRHLAALKLNVKGH